MYPMEVVVPLVFMAVYLILNLAVILGTSLLMQWRGYSPRQREIGAPAAVGIANTGFALAAWHEDLPVLAAFMGLMALVGYYGALEMWWRGRKRSA